MTTQTPQPLIVFDEVRPRIVGNGRLELVLSASEASQEGVEGEPEATLGGVGGSPLGVCWCRFCGAEAFDQMQCVKCWSRSLEVGVVFEGVATQEFVDRMQQVVLPAIGSTLDSVQSLGQAIQEVGLTLGQCGEALMPRAG